MTSNKVSPPNASAPSALAQRSLAAAALLMAAAAAPALGGTLAVVHSFTGGADGATPYKGVTIDKSGTLYGITTYGADACPDSYYYSAVGCGVLFKQTAGGVFTPLVTFLGTSNGASPNGNLTLSGTTLLGTTYTGGAADQGTVFQVKTTGKAFKQLYSFSGPDGSHPATYPRLDASGNLYSATQYGGPGYDGTDLSGNGVLFEISSKGHWTAQHYFSGGAVAACLAGSSSPRPARSSVPPTRAEAAPGLAFLPQAAAWCSVSCRRAEFLQPSTRSRAVRTAIFLFWGTRIARAISTAPPSMAARMGTARCSSW